MLVLRITAMTRQTRANINTFNKIKFSPTRIKATMPEAVKYPEMNLKRLEALGKLVQLDQELGLLDPENKI